MVYRYAVELSFAGGGGPGANVFHFRTTGGVGDAQEAVTALESFYTGLLSWYPTSTTITGPDVVISGIEGETPEYEAVDGFSLTGTGAGAQQAQLLAGVIGWRTANATRSGRGRTFVGPLTASTLQTDGTLDPDFVTALEAAGQGIVDHNGSWLNGAIGVWSPTYSVLRDITAYAVKDRYSYLSSRRHSA